MQYLYSLDTIGQTLNYWTAFSGGMFFHATTIYVFARSAGWVSRFMGSKTMVFMGEISFAFYMIHLPLIHFVKAKYWIGSNFSVVYFAALTLALSVVVSAWLYFFVEVPMKQTMLKWYSGDSKPRQLLFEMLVKPFQRVKRPAVLTALILGIVMPIAITKYYQRSDRKSHTAANVMKSVPLDFQTVEFGEQVELLAADIIPRRGVTRFSTVWKFSTPGKAIVSLHFPGTGHDSRVQEVTCRPEDVGQPVIVNSNVHPGKFEAANGIGLSLDFNGQQVAFDTPKSKAAESGTNHYPVFSRDQLQEGLRISRLPVLTR